MGEREDEGGGRWETSDLREGGRVEIEGGALVDLGLYKGGFWNAHENLKATPTFTLTTPTFDQGWPTLAPPGPLLYLRAAIRQENADEVS